MKKNRIALVVLVLAFTLHLEAQVAGSLDSGFGVNGKVFNLSASKVFYAGISSKAIQQDGKILVLINGYADNQGKQSAGYRLCRYSQDGTYDPDFNDSGSVAIRFLTSRLVLQPDNKIIVAGRDGEEIMLMRLLPNGHIDSSYGDFGIIHTGLFTAMSSTLLQPDGKLLICGTAFADAKLFVVRFNSDGSRDFGFGDQGLKLVAFGDFYHQALAMAVQYDGRILLTGYIIKDNLYNTVITRFDAKGQPDSSFNRIGRQVIPLQAFFVSNIIVQGDHNILLGGTYFFNNYSSTGLALARIRENGHADSSFGNKGIKTTSYGSSSDELFDMLLQWDGRILVAGRSSDKFAMARLMPNGNYDVSFNGNGRQVTSFGTGSSGADKIFLKGNKIYLFGLTNINNTTYAFSMARYHLDFNSGIDELSKKHQLHVFPNPATDLCTLAYTLSQPGVVHVSLTDVAGRMVREFVQDESRSSGEQQELIQLGDDIPAGCYILTLSTGKDLMQVRLLKQ
jgi:uncharacterized delta-60 repeat protein